MLKDIISIASGFQSSVNIEYDFNDESKISGFIPTSSALSVINSILENTANGRIERAKIMTGGIRKRQIAHCISFTGCTLQ